MKELQEVRTVQNERSNSYKHDDMIPVLKDWSLAVEYFLIQKEKSSQLQWDWRKGRKRNKQLNSPAAAAAAMGKDFSMCPGHVFINLSNFMILCWPLAPL